MYFLAGFFGTAIVVPTVNFLLTVLVLATLRSQRKRKVFFGILGGGLWTALHYDLHHLGNNIPSGVLAAITIAAWCFLPRWARLSEPGASKASWLQL